MSAVRRPWWVLFALAFVAAACAEIGEPDLGQGLAAVPTTAPPDDAAADDEPTELVLGAATPVFTPSRPDGYVPAVLVSTDEGTLVLASADDGSVLAPEPVAPVTDPEPGAALVEETTTTSVPVEFEEVDSGTTTSLPIASLPAALALDDYLGGLVVQSLDGDVRWAPSNLSDTRLVSQGGAQLLEVGFLEASLAVQVFVGVPGAIDRIGVADGERRQFAVLEPGEELVDFASSNGIQVLIVGDEACGSMRFLNILGEPVDLGGPPVPSCLVDRRPLYSSVALSPDGDQLAYARVRYRGDGLPASTELIILELSSDVLLFSAPVGGPGEQVESLAFDGDRAVFLRTGETGRSVVLLDTATGVETTIPGVQNVNAVSFARLPLSLATTTEPPTTGGGDETAEAASSDG